MLISALLGKREEKRDLGINTPGLLDWFVFGGGKPVSSGVRVTEQTSLQCVAVWACVSYIADYVASLPKITYRRLQPRGKQRAQNHYLYPILHDQPNPYQNDYEFVETLTGHVLLGGNAYAEIERDGAGKVANLWPLRPDRIRVVLQPDRIIYFYTLPDGGEVALREVLHLRGFNSDGIMGYSPIRMAREAVGLAIAEEEYRARFLGNNANPGGVLEHPNQLTDEAARRLRESWERMHQGLTNAHRVAILEEGVKWHQIGLAAKDIEFLEGRKYQKSEIATLFRVKPYKIGVLEPGTVSYASIEQQAIDTHIDTMRPWILRWERKFNALLTPAERRSYFVEFLMDAVLRGDTKSRYESYQFARQNGWLNANEIRELENMNPIDGPEGDEYWQPSNMVGAADPAPLPAPNGNGRGLNGHDTV